MNNINSAASQHIKRVLQMTSLVLLISGCQSIILPTENANQNDLLSVEQEASTPNSATTRQSAAAENQSPPCDEQCIAEWRLNTHEKISALANSTNQLLESGHLSAAEAAIVHAQNITDYLKSNMALARLSRAETPQATDIPPKNSNITPQTKINDSDTEAQQHATTDWTSISAELTRMNQQLQEFRQVMAAQLTERTKYYHAKWLNNELQRLQLKADSPGFHLFTNFQLRHRQRQAQNELQTLLAQMAELISHGKHDLVSQQAPTLALLSGQAETEHSGLSSKLLEKAFGPVLADRKIQEALNATLHYLHNGGAEQETDSENEHIADNQHVGASGLSRSSRKNNFQTLVKKQHHQPIKKQASPTGKNSKKPQWVSLSNALDKAMRASDLPSIQHLVHQLRQQPDLPLEQRLRAEAMESFLKHQIESLNVQADALYQQGHLHDAKALWQMLSGLKPEDAQLTAKIARAEKVLENLAALREQPQLTPPPATP